MRHSIAWPCQSISSCVNDNGSPVATQELFAHEIATSYEFSDRMLHLKRVFISRK